MDDARKAGLIQQGATARLARRNRCSA